MFSNDSNIQLGSKRTLDDNGYLHVEDCVLTGEEVANYLGREIAGYKDLGLDGDQLYGIYRPLAEIKKAASTFDGVPLTDNHILIDPNKPNQNKIVGTTGTSCRVEDGKLKNTVVLWVGKAIDNVSKADDGVGGKKDLSCGYSYDLVPEEGVFNGTPYRFKMVNIKGNHVAHVEEGRNPDAMIADSLEGTKMKKTLFQTLFGIFAGDEKDNTKIVKSLKSVAQDGTISDENKLQALTELALALDESHPEREIMSGFDEEEEEVKAKDKKAKDKKAKDEELEKKEEKLAGDESEEEEKEAKDKKAKDEDPEEKEKAMDQAIRAREAVIGLCNKAVGKMSDKFIADSSPEQMIDNALTKHNLNIKGKSLDAKVAMLEVIAATKQSQKITKQAVDSVAKDYVSLIPSKGTK